MKTGRKRSPYATALIIILGVLGVIVIVHLALGWYFLQSKLAIHEVKSSGSASTRATATAVGPLGYYIALSPIETKDFRLVYISVDMPYGSTTAYPMDVVLHDRRPGAHAVPVVDGEPGDQIRVLPTAVELANGTVKFSGHDKAAGNVTFAGTLKMDGSAYVMKGDLTLNGQAFHDVELMAAQHP